MSSTLIGVETPAASPVASSPRGTVSFAVIR